MDDGSKPPLLWVILLILGAAYCAITETALSSVSRNKIKAASDHGNQRARKVLDILDDGRGRDERECEFLAVGRGKFHQHLDQREQAVRLFRCGRIVAEAIFPHGPTPFPSKPSVAPSPSTKSISIRKVLKIAPRWHCQCAGKMWKDIRLSIREQIPRLAGGIAFGCLPTKTIPLLCISMNSPMKSTHCR